MTHPPHIFGLYGAVPVAIQTLLACALVVLVLSLLLRRDLAEMA